MSVKNSSMDIKYHEIYNRYKEIIDIFIYANNMGIFEITMSYLLKNTLTPQLELYRKMHELLEIKIIDVCNYTECPYCMKYNKVDASTKIRCSKCRNMYTNERIIEKFKLVRKVKDE